MELTPISDSAFSGELASYEENLFGNIFERDLSDADVASDPLIKHYTDANHFLDYDMTLRRVKFRLRIKFFFRDLFSRKPKKPKEGI